VSGVRDRAQGSQDVVPTSLILKRSAQDLCDERAALAPAYSPVQLRDKLFVEINEHTHANNLAHQASGPRLVLQPSAAHRAAIVRPVRRVTRPPKHRQHPDGREDHRSEHERDLTLSGE
jgi:hypothetical protein